MNFDLNNCSFLDFSNQNETFDRHSLQSLSQKIIQEASGNRSGIYADSRLHPLQNSGLLYNPTTDEYIGFQALRCYKADFQKNEYVRCELPNYDSNYFSSISQLTLEFQPFFIYNGLRFTTFCFRFNNIYVFQRPNPFQGTEKEYYDKQYEKGFPRGNSITEEIHLPQYETIAAAGFDVVFHMAEGCFTLLNPKNQVTRCAWIEVPPEVR